MYCIVLLQIYNPVICMHQILKKKLDLHTCIVCIHIIYIITGDKISENLLLLNNLEDYFG